MKLPPIARPPERLSLKHLRTMARQPGSKDLLRRQRAQLREIRDQYAEHARLQLEAHDELLARYDMAIDGEIEA